MEEQQLEEKPVKKVKCRFCGKEVSEEMNMLLGKMKQKRLFL